MRPQGPSGSLTLVVRRLIPASPDTVFSAWTEPAHLLKWWGPRGVSLAAAEIDLRVGGRYRLANQYQDGSVLWISGVFEVIDRPHLITSSSTSVSNVRTTAPCTRFPSRVSSPSIIHTEPARVAKVSATPSTSI